MEGQVVAVGNGKTLDDGKLLKPDVKVGDKVLFSKYAGTEIKLDGDEHLVLREDDLLGVILPQPLRAISKFCRAPHLVLTCATRMV